MPYRDDRERRHWHPDAFQTVWNELGPFNTDLMASSASAQRVPPSFYTRRFSYGAMARAPRGVDVLAQDVARVLGTGEPLDYVYILCTPAVYDRTHSPTPGRVSGERGYCRG